ncbi:MAG TPA: cytochrome c biogenesis protein DipZ [Cytophagaceae bacterium]|nr:cytochrome c biogenesis protein DipZ [Cytophagaceae bacterium]
MIETLVAFLAGILTAGAPCILPLLPILLGTSIGQESKWRPVFITLGFVVTFSTLGILFSAFAHILGISQNSLRLGGVIFLALFALFMIWPTPFEMFTNKIMGKFINRAYKTGDKYGTGNPGGFIIGITLGVIWTPCAGPVLASILTLIAVSKEFSKAIFLMLAYSAGSGIPMLIVAYGGQLASKRIKSFAPYTRRIQQFFGVLILLLSVAIYFQYDTLIQSKLTKYFPSQKLEEKIAHKSADEDRNRQVNTTGEDLTGKNQAPEFIGITQWFNTPSPLTMQSLKGKVVLIDFWTYSCINCIRTLPYLKQWNNSYKDRGLLIVGVHTPEFAFEKDPGNIERAVKINSITYPVAMDNNYLTWNAYHNSYWPAHYLINQNGDIVYTHFGEGAYMETENKIRLLIGLDKVKGKEETNQPREVKSPEMYFGSQRRENLSPFQTASENARTYQLPEKIALNNFAFEGTWQFENEYVKLISSSGKVKLRFYSGKVYMVAKPSGKNVKAIIYVDGKKLSKINVNESKLYTLFNSDEYKEHSLEIQFDDSGVELFTFTFG